MWSIRSSDCVNKERMDLSIIIPVYNNINFTRNALNDLLQLPSNHEIIIVDNASSDETPMVMNEFLNKQNPERAKLVYIGCPRNLGFGRANNKGYKHSVGENVLFLNNDIRVQSDFQSWTKPIIENCKLDKMISPNGGLLDGNFNFIRETDDLRNDANFYLSGWCLASSRKVFDSLILNHYSHDQTDLIMEGRAWGPWNEKFFAYFEDGDLTWRAKQQGIPIDVLHVPVHHFGKMTSRKLDLSAMYKKSLGIFREIWAEKLAK